MSDRFLKVLQQQNVGAAVRLSSDVCAFSAVAWAEQRLGPASGGRSMPVIRRADRTEWDELKLGINQRATPGRNV